MRVARATRGRCCGSGGRSIHRRWPRRLDTVQRPIDVHGAAEQPRAPGAVVDAFNRLDRAQKHGLRHTFFARDHVEAVPESIDEIHVGVPRRTEHDGVARCLAASRVCGEILRAEVRLGLHDPADAPQTSEPVHQVHPDELPRDDERAAGIEVPGQLRRGMGQSVASITACACEPSLLRRALTWAPSPPPPRRAHLLHARCLDRAAQPARE